MLVPRFRPRIRHLGFGLLAVAVAACGDDDDNSGPPATATYSAVQSTLVADCAGCHDAGSGRIYLTTMDSTQLLNSGLVAPSDPPSSILIRKATNATPHGGGAIAGFTADDQALTEEWIALLPEPTGNVLEAVRVGSGTGTSAPVVDGSPDAAWGEALPVSFQIGGGWGEATSVQMRAVYDDTYLYMLVIWDDDEYSDRRVPWLKQQDGTWRVTPAKSPLPAPGVNWTEYVAAAQFDEEDPARFAYEDKFAIIWNTYGTSTVDGFDQSGCAVLCHDPANAEGPGTTYNYSDQSQAAKKFTSVQGQVADMWHWKMVRSNHHQKMDDQYVGYWLRGATNAGNGGRYNDAGTAGYREVPSVNGHPSFRNPSTTVPPYYILESEKVALSDAEAAALPAGTVLANMLTQTPTGGRADVDAFGVHNRATGRWTYELRRRLVTGEATDVQFDDLARSYFFGVAVFDNAQIEHSYMGLPGRLTFRR